MKKLDNKELVKIYGGTNHFSYTLGKYTAKYLKAEAMMDGVGLAAIGVVAAL